MKRAELMGYEWMVKHTPQEEWIRGRGLMLWLAFFFSEIGAGMYLVSLFLNFPPGRVTGWLVTLVLGGVVHMAYLGQPLRSWRILTRPATSELSRGLWGILFFAVIGFFQVAPVVYPGLPWSGSGIPLKAVMGILCVLLITHGFMTMGVVKALPIWNTSMMIPLSLLSGIWVGSQAVEVMLFIAGKAVYPAELWARWSLLGYTAALGLFLWGTAHASETARVSAGKFLKGDGMPFFYIGVVLVGIIIPLAITFSLWTSGAGQAGGGTILVRFVCVMVGDLAMRYNIMKSALYMPLI
jgi:DMSO reductase anchor subunit